MRKTWYQSCISHQHNIVQWLLKSGIVYLTDCKSVLSFANSGIHCKIVQWWSAKIINAHANIKWFTVPEVIFSWDSFNTIQSFKSKTHTTICILFKANRNYVNKPFMKWILIYYDFSNVWYIRKFIFENCQILFHLTEITVMKLIFNIWQIYSVSAPFQYDMDAFPKYMLKIQCNVNV